jgi:hypothetical protein
VRVETAADGSIRIEDRPTILRRGMLLCAALSLALVLVHLSGVPGPAHAVPSLLGIALFCAALAVFSEDSLFQFDAAAREVRWTRRGLRGTRAGVIPFAEVEKVVMRSEMSLNSFNEAHFSGRVFLVTQGTSMRLSSDLDTRQALDVVARLQELIRQT